MVRLFRHNSIASSTHEPYTEKLSTRARFSLARNEKNPQQGEDDEERAYNWIRVWVKTEMKEVSDLRFRKESEERLLFKAQEQVKSLNTKIGSLNAILKRMHAWRGSWDDPNAPSNELLDEESMDPLKNPLQNTQRMLQVLTTQRNDFLRDDCDKRKRTIDDLERQAQLAEHTKEKSWENYRSDFASGKKDNEVRAQLSLEHTRRYLVHFLKYQGYFRQLPQMRSQWISAKMMSVGGGVSNSQ